MELYLGVVHTPEMKARLRWRGKPESEAFFFFFSKAKQSERSSGVNEYAVCCHALFLYPAVVRGSGKGEKLFFRSGLPGGSCTHSHQWCGLYETYVVSAAQTHIGSFFKGVETAPTRTTSICSYLIRNQMHNPTRAHTLTQTYSRQRRVGINFERRRCQVHKLRMD